MSARRAGVARDLLALVAITVGAIVIHGYHPGIEDAEIYLPGILKQLHPDLFPAHTVFFASHAHLTIFPELIAASMRGLPWSPAVTLLAWQAAAIFVLLFACRWIGRTVLPSQRAVWAGVMLVGSLLTIPVAGTDLYLMDQYLTPRSFSAPLSLLAVACLLDDHPVWAVICVGAIAPIHPLMVVFAAALLVAVFLARRIGSAETAWAVTAPAFFPPVTRAYRRVLGTRPSFLLTKWAWYAWIGLAAPFVIFGGLVGVARRRGHTALAALCRAMLIFEGGCLLVALVISVPGPFERFAELQPMRGLQLVYLVMLLIGGGLIGEHLLGRHPWRWVALFGPICTGMLIAQVRLFPASRHLELPGLAPENTWVQTFVWVRDHTPRDAYFVLDPGYLSRQGEDEHGFRAIAERSRLADAVKDSGVASMFPDLSTPWAEQVDALDGWSGFTARDFTRLRQRFGVDWAITERMVPGLECVYRNGPLSVCRIPAN